MRKKCKELSDLLKKRILKKYKFKVGYKPETTSQITLWEDSKAYQIFCYLNVHKVELEEGSEVKGVLTRFSTVRNYVVWHSRKKKTEFGELVFSKSLDWISERLV